MTRPLAARAPALLQLLRSPYLTFTRQLPADARALLLALLLAAHQVHRPGGPPVLRLSASGLADHLGLPRRRLTKLLAALEAAGAVAWRPGSGGRDGRLEVIAYPNLVRDGRRELDGSFVQLLVEPLEAERRRLGFDAWATLLGLLIHVPWARHQLKGSGARLAELLGMSWRALRRHTAGLAGAGLVTWTAQARSSSQAVIQVTAYRRLVRVVISDEAPVAKSRAAAGVSRPTGRDGKARGASRNRAQLVAESRAAPAVSAPLDRRETDTDFLPYPEPNSEELSTRPGEGKAGIEQRPDQQAADPDEGFQSALVELASALESQGVAHDLLKRRNRPGLRALSRRLSELAGNGWEPDALRDELLDGLHGVRSTTAVLLHRARSLPTGPGTEPSAGDEQAEAVAREQRERRLEAARAHTRNLLAIDGIEPDDVLGGLWRYRQDADAYESAVGELLRLRPEATALLDGWSVAS